MPVSPKMLGNLTITSFIALPTLGNTRLMTNSTPTKMYGIHARALLIGLQVALSTLISIEPSHWLGHSLAGAKSQDCLGVKKLKRAAVVTIAKPIKPPSKDGNSGPNKIPVAT